MNKSIQDTIKSFQQFNGIDVHNYYAQKEPDDHLALLDQYIGEDVFEKNIMEWLEICETEDEKNCLLELLEEYLYFPEQRFRRALKSIIEELKTKGACIEDTLFVTFPSKKGVVCGGSYISGLLMVNMIGIAVKDNVISDVEKATETLKERIASYSTIVFVDDVVGSGKTLYSNVTSFMERFEFNPDANFYVTCICGREKKIKQKIKCFQKVLNKRFEYIVLYPVKKCLDETLKPGMDKRKEVVSRIEKIIDEFALEEKDVSYCCGFENSQLVVSFYYNTPNNTLSLFWRPTEISVPLFTRTSYRRPTIDECREQKRRMTENAYLRGRVKKGILDDTDDSGNSSFVY